MEFNVYVMEGNRVMHGKGINMTNEPVTFGGALRQLRRRNPRNISLAAVADELGVTIAYVSDVERDKKNPLSEEQIDIVLKFLEEESERERMLDLAARSRRTVEFEIEDPSEPMTDLLVALKRSSGDGTLDKGKIEHILKLLNPGGKKDDSGSLGPPS